MRLLSCIVLITTAANICFSIEPTEKFSWKIFDYLWDNSTQKQNAIKSGLYNANASVLYDVDEASDGRTFVTLIKKKGVPASLTTVSNKTGPSGPFLKPYPNWSWYNNNYTCNNHTIISVYRISIKCNYLFVLDSGVIESKTVCPPKLLIFDLKTDELTEHITIPHDIATHDDKSIGLLVTPIVDIQNCNLDNATIFMADSYGNGLIKYNKYTGLCRIESDFMKPNNADTTFTVQNQRFHLDNGGILGLTTIDEVLYYAALSGHKIFKMNMHDLRNCSKLNKAKTNNLTELAGTLSGQTGPIASVQSVLFFSNIPNASILCVDATKQFNSSDTVRHFDIFSNRYLIKNNFNTLFVLY
ncbi:hypothetical protein PUN28_002773 [Cardiocondyla obscurior]|uniref:Bee-milk protein n=1 Tax=Cardiocondyla obscurior TaxID=286306 RepID=A0AAW2GVZ1_9HYME